MVFRGRRSQRGGYSAAAVPAIMKSLMVPKLLPKIMKMARKRTRRGKGFIPPKYRPFKLFGAKRKQLLDPLLKKVALAMKRAKRT